jgi:NADH:ubiquinone oxidoreductase subunit 6 (subunit J)
MNEAVGMRTQSDQMMEGIWYVLAILSSLIALIGIIAITWDARSNATQIRNGVRGSYLWPIALGMVLVIVGFIIYIIINYKLLKRNEAHSSRERMLREGIFDYLTSKARERGMEGAIASQIATMQMIHSESNGEETNQHGWLAILLIIPVVNFFVLLYVLYILTQYNIKHDQRWNAFTQQTQSARQVLGIPIVFASWKNTPKMSFWLYLIASIFTLGIFTIYWYYALMKDMNEHYKTQWQFEDQLIKG